MKALGTKDIIKILPFSQENKDALLGNWETMDQGQRYELENIIWEYYDSVCEMRYQYNLQQALADVQQGLRKLDDNLYKSVREKSEKEIDEEAMKKLTNQDIDDIRNKLKTFIEKSSVIK